MALCAILVNFEEYFIKMGLVRLNTRDAIGWRKRDEKSHNPKWRSPAL